MAFEDHLIDGSWNVCWDFERDDWVKDQDLDWGWGSKKEVAGKVTMPDAQAQLKGFELRPFAGDVANGSMYPGQDGKSKWSWSQGWKSSKPWVEEQPWNMENVSGGGPWSGVGLGASPDLPFSWAGAPKPQQDLPFCEFTPGVFWPGAFQNEEIKEAAIAPKTPPKTVPAGPDSKRASKVDLEKPSHFHDGGVGPVAMSDSEDSDGGEWQTKTWKQKSKGWEDSHGRRKTGDGVGKDSPPRAEKADQEGEGERRKDKKSDKKDKKDKGAGKGRSQGKGEGKQVDPSKSEKDLKDDINAQIEALTIQVGGALEKADFDDGVHRFLVALGKNCGMQKVSDAFVMIHTYTAHKARSSVRNWPAYLLTLLKKFEPDPFGKGKGKGRGHGQEEATIIHVQAASAPSATTAEKKEPTPAIPAPSGSLTGLATALAPRASGKHPWEAKEKAAEPLKEADEPPLKELLPPTWDDEHKELLAVLGKSFGDSLRCPFRDEPLDLDTVVASAAQSLGQGTSLAAGASRHFVGFTASCELSAFTRSQQAAEASRLIPAAVLSKVVTPGELARKVAAAATGKSSQQQTSCGIILQELALESCVALLAQLGR